MTTVDHPLVKPSAEFTDIVLNHLSSFHPLPDRLSRDLSAKLFEVKVKKGEYLLKQGETSRHLYLIIRGIVIGYSERKGRKLTTYICSDGDSVSSISGMYGVGPSGESMVAAEDSHLIGLPLTDLLHFLETSFEMNVVIRKILENFYKMAHERSNLVRMGTAQEKYEHYLSTLPQYIDRIPPEYIADFLDINPKTLLKLLKEGRGSEQSLIQNRCMQIEHYLLKSEAFKRHGLTLAIMANDLSIPPHQLSHILNIYYKKGFNTFINGYRVAYVKNKLQNDVRWQRLKIEALGLEGGFSSRSVFFSEFRAQVGMSPAEYAKAIVKLSPDL